MPSYGLLQLDDNAFEAIKKVKKKSKSELKEIAEAIEKAQNPKEFGAILERLVRIMMTASRVDDKSNQKIFKLSQNLFNMLLKNCPLPDQQLDRNTQLDKITTPQNELIYPSLATIKREFRHVLENSSHPGLKEKLTNIVMLLDFGSYTEASNALQKINDDEAGDLKNYLVFLRSTFNDITRSEKFKDAIEHDKRGLGFAITNEMRQADTDIFYLCKRYKESLNHPDVMQKTLNHVDRLMRALQHHPDLTIKSLALKSLKNILTSPDPVVQSMLTEYNAKRADVLLPYQIYARLNLPNVENATDQTQNILAMCLTGLKNPAQKKPEESPQIEDAEIEQYAAVLLMRVDVNDILQFIITLQDLAVDDITKSTIQGNAQKLLSAIITADRFQEKIPSSFAKSPAFHEFLGKISNDRQADLISKSIVQALALRDDKMEFTRFATETIAKDESKKLDLNDFLNNELQTLDPNGNDYQNYLKTFAKSLFVKQIELMLNLRPSDSYNQAWTKDSKKKDNHLHHFTQFTTALSSSIMSSIMNPPSAEQRRKIALFYAHLMQQCLDMTNTTKNDINDFMSANAIYSALTNSEIRPFIKKGQDDIKKGQDEAFNQAFHSIIKEFDTIFDPSGNFRNYRQAINHSKSNQKLYTLCIPFLQTEIVFTDDYFNDNKIPEDRWYKIRGQHYQDLNRLGDRFLDYLNKHNPSVDVNIMSYIADQLSRIQAVKSPSAPGRLESSGAPLVESVPFQRASSTSLGSSEQRSHPVQPRFQLAQTRTAGVPTAPTTSTSQTGTEPGANKADPAHTARGIANAAQEELRRRQEAQSRRASQGPEDQGILPSSKPPRSRPEFIGGQRAAATKTTPPTSTPSHQGSEGPDPDNKPKKKDPKGL